MNPSEVTKLSAGISGYRISAEHLLSALAYTAVLGGAFYDALTSTDDTLQIGDLEPVYGGI
jgi:hypothetical protein